MDACDARLAARARGQLGLFSRAQAHAAGFSDKQLHRRLRLGTIERVGAGVFTIAGTPLSWEQRALAAMMAVGPLAWLSHRAAAYVLGFDGFGECPIELTVPRGVRPVSSAIVHTTTYLHPLDRTSVGRFSVSSGARTIIDLCAVRATERQLSAAIGSAIRDGYSSELFLRTRLANLRGPGRHGIRLLDRVLEGPIGHSHLERAFLKLVRQAGIEPPEVQVIFDGERVIRVDCFWRRHRVVVEVMGHRHHATREQLQRDAQRRNELQEIGSLVIEFTSDDVARRPAYCMARLRRNLIARTPV
jgi:very-short-patch-repair endonuclease